MIERIHVYPDIVKILSLITQTPCQCTACCIFWNAKCSKLDF